MTSDSGSTFWRRWIAPRLLKLTIQDWTLWVSFAVGTVLVMVPTLTPFKLARGIAMESLSLAVITFAAIGLGVSVALGALVTTFPEGRLRRALHAPAPGGKTSAFADLAFVAFWAGSSNLLAAAIAIASLVLTGPMRILCSEDLIPAIFSGLLCASTLYALLQMLAALVALLETAGLREKFKE